ncbi:flavin reductase family protein [Gilvimarinus agarilyticus]|uniref:flavin reductase family protein n=1 Tax=unclassified Gilvimarinus TaxID=2642066 RepID=UPI001C08597D|nr:MULTISPECIES: flavin reductase family protein [unclassified Gilvimarinus]MBU2885061.1 flavin reductase family protein [Gilvimarinus agarilyticus]MDO6569958.1 flavin reductase family protein [Gilvimarinus sp. 2_MG-2023]MDO6747224.1 flavin reductase family protein [Gilvimarinus sp. 1_MG-2023]
MHNTDIGLAMKQGMRRLASGVSVLSTRVNHDERFAMTVSSVTSVSDNPPSLLVCINKQVSLQGHIETLGCTFAVNVLSQQQQQISNVCAGFEPVQDRFSVGSWLEGPDSVPYLTESEVVFFCQSDKVVSYGTHHIVIAKIEDVLVSERHTDPLVYHNGGYAKLSHA